MGINFVKNICLTILMDRMVSACKSLATSNHHMKYEPHLFPFSSIAGCNERSHRIKRLAYVISTSTSTFQRLLFAETTNITLESRFNFGEKQQLWDLNNNEMNGNVQFVFSILRLLFVFDTFVLFIQTAIKINHFCVFSFFSFWWTSSFFLNVFLVSSRYHFTVTVLRFKAQGIIYI